MKRKFKRIIGSILLTALFMGLIPGRILAEATVQLQTLFVDQQYSYVDLYGISNAGLSAVEEDNLYGYIDKTGQVVIPLQFEAGRSFNDGLAAVMKDKNYGYIDTNGEMVIPNKYSTAGDFKDGFAKVSNNGKNGYVNKKGEEVIPLLYNTISDIVDGYATASNYDLATKKINWYIVNINGGSKRIECNRLYIVDKKFVKAEYKDGVSYMDLEGKPLDLRGYKKVGTISNGLMAVSKDGVNFGYMNMQGIVTIPFEYVTSGYFDNNGIAFVAKEKNNTFGIDKTGKTVIQPDNYYRIEPFPTYSNKDNKDYYYVVKQDASLKLKEGVVDYHGNVVVPPNYDTIETFNGFSDGLIAVSNSGQYGFADTKGNLKIPMSYDSVGKFSEGLAAVKKEGKWGFIDTQGNTVIPFQYDQVSPAGFKNSLITVVKDGNAGAIDTSGNIVIPLEYNLIRDIYITPDGFLWTSQYSNYKSGPIRNYSLYSINKTAEPTQSAVLVDGNRVPFEAFNIDGSNYFKLRDIAKVLHGSGKQVAIGWDETANSITITTGKGYTSVGGELSVSGNTENKAASITNSKILLNGKEIKLTAYQINGSNYFKLRDLAAQIDFGITWDESTSTIGIDTSSGYKK